MPEAKKIKPDFAILPSVNVLLDQLADLHDIIDPKYLKRIINQIITEIKNNPAHYKLERQNRSSISKIILTRVRDRVRQLKTPSPRHVINATGVILHTGLGRAPFDNKILNVSNELTGYTNLEIRLDNGKRGERVDHVSSLLQLLTGAEGAVVVNNNAAAVLLMLNSIARRREVIVSRGELVEIGGSFRMPEVMISSGAKMVEVGATNKTHLEDYARAITDKTAAILLVHPSNYQIIGFSAKPDPNEIIKLAHNNNIPVIFDVGSGALVDMREFGLDYEPLIPELIDQGFDLLSFSGDKLLGGPQAGIIVGRQKWITRIEKNHLLRALRCDKFTLGLLSGTLRGYLHSEKLRTENPTLFLFGRPIAEQKDLAADIVRAVGNTDKISLKIVSATGKVGSGAYPVSQIKAMAIRFESKHLSAQKISNEMRMNDVPIFGYIEDDTYHLNMLAVFAADIPLITAAIRNIK